MLLIAGAFVAAPFMRTPVSSNGAQSALITALVCFSAMTAYLLFAQFYATRMRALVILGAAYYYVTLLGIPYLLAYLDVGFKGLTLASDDAAGWISLFWIGGFGLLALLYAFAQSRDRTQLGAQDASQLLINVLITTTVVAVLVTAPLLLVKQLSPVPLRIVGPIVSGISIAALFVTLIATRGRTVLHLWLIVALVAQLLDATLMTAFGDPHGVGWYVVMFYRWMTATLLLVPLLGELSAVSARMATLAGLDGLTGLPNRRTLDDRVDSFLTDGRRRSDWLSALMIDIDHFKPFNDTFGHAAGDEALRAVAKVINRSLARSGDFAARYGGEEFCVLLPNTDREGALVVAERIRAGVARLQLKHTTGMHRLTVSIGLACLLRSDIASADLLLSMADRALYHAKASGRNCVSESSGLLTIVPKPGEKPGAAAR